MSAKTYKSEKKYLDLKHLMTQEFAGEYVGKLYDEGIEEIDTGPGQRCATNRVDDRRRS